MNMEEFKRSLFKLGYSDIGLRTTITYKDTDDDRELTNEDIDFLVITFSVPSTKCDEDQYIKNFNDQMERSDNISIFQIERSERSRMTFDRYTGEYKVKVHKRSMYKLPGYDEALSHINFFFKKLFDLNLTSMSSYDPEKDAVGIVDIHDSRFHTDFIHEIFTEMLPHDPSKNEDFLYPIYEYENVKDIDNGGNSIFDIILYKQDLSEANMQLIKTTLKEASNLYKN